MLALAPGETWKSQSESESDSSAFLAFFSAGFSCSCQECFRQWIAFKLGTTWRFLPSQFKYRSGHRWPQRAEEAERSRRRNLRRTRTRPGQLELLVPIHHYQTCSNPGRDESCLIRTSQQDGLIHSNLSLFKVT